MEKERQGAIPVMALLPCMDAKRRLMQKDGAPAHVAMVELTCMGDQSDPKGGLVGVAR